MKTRAITGLLFIAVLIIAVLLGPYTFVLLFSLIAACAVYEFYRMVQSENTKLFLYLAPGVAADGLGFTSLVLLDLLLATLLRVVIIGFFLCVSMALVLEAASPIQCLSYSLSSLLCVVIPLIFFMRLGVYGDTDHAYSPRVFSALL